MIRESGRLTSNRTSLIHGLDSHALFRHPPVRRSGARHVARSGRWMALARMVEVWLRVDRTAPAGEVSRRWTSQLGESRLLLAAAGGQNSGSPALRIPSTSWSHFST